MISISDKHNCCGCEACVQRCPKQCISFNEDEEGFRYPVVDFKHCIDCGLCEKVCPVINQYEPQHPLQAYAAINPNEDVRAKSSSGGVFTAIAEKVIESGGVVFGARFDDFWGVEHIYVDCIEGLQFLRGSKYVQSRIGESFLQAESYLKTGRLVLFSGTSCQISGLKHFLRKTYDNLLTVEVVCHGVPSPKLWREYLSTISSADEINRISMKDKSKSWRGYSITIEANGITLSEPAIRNKYMLSFIQNLSLRPSCYRCPAKSCKSGSDILLGDYWGVEKLFPDMDDNRGTSFVCANTDKGVEFIRTLTLKSKLANFSASVPYNACLERSTLEPQSRNVFWQGYKQNGVKTLLALNPVKTNFFKRILRRINKSFK